MNVRQTGSAVLAGLLMLAVDVAGCGSSAKLMSGLSIEELKIILFN